MAFTTGVRALHINIPLSNVAIAYKPMNMIAETLAPIVTVPKQADAYYIWNSADAFRTEDDKRAPGTKANEITWSVDTATFYCENYALAHKIPYEDIENADAPQLLTERSGRLMRIKDKLYLNWEYRVAQQVNSGSNVGSYSGVGSNWSAQTTGKSDPIGDLNDAINNVEDSTGYKPNRVIFGKTAWRLYRNHADVRDFVFGSAGTGKNGRLVTLEHVKSIHEVDIVTVGGAYYNSADEGQSQSLTKIWDTNVLVYYAPTAPTKDSPSFMYSFRWNKVMTMQAQIFQLDENGAEKVQLGYYQDEKITGANLGFLITDVRSSV